jgi:hypothetical protein
MQKPLNNEGIIVKNDTVLNFRKIFQGPSVELYRQFCVYLKKY